MSEWVKNTDNRKVFQKTFSGTIQKEIDTQVNDFIAQNEVISTQSHFEKGVHIRILFFKVK